MLGNIPLATGGTGEGRLEETVLGLRDGVTLGTLVPGDGRELEKILG